MLKYILQTRKTRQELANILNTSDRDVRRQIQELRESGYIVHADTDGKGYCIAHTDFERNQTRRLFDSRLESEISTRYAMFGYEDTREFLVKQLAVVDERVKYENS